MRDHFGTCYVSKPFPRSSQFKLHNSSWISLFMSILVQVCQTFTLQSTLHQLFVALCTRKLISIDFITQTFSPFGFWLGSAHGKHWPEIGGWGERLRYLFTTFAVPYLMGYSWQRLCSSSQDYSFFWRGTSLKLQILEGSGKAIYHPLNLSIPQRGNGFPLL